MQILWFLGSVAGKLEQNQESYDNDINKGVNHCSCRLRKSSDLLKMHFLFLKHFHFFKVFIQAKRKVFLYPKQRKRLTYLKQLRHFLYTSFHGKG